MVRDSARLMRLRIEDGLLLAAATLQHGERTMTLPDALIDTGSARTLVAYAALEEVGWEPQLEDELRRIRGAGGSESVLSTHIGALALDTMRVEDFIIQAGAMEYGYPLDAIIGIDFLMAVGAALDLRRLEIYPAAPARAGRRRTG